MQNLNQLFSKSSPSQTADVIRLHHGLVSLFKRPDSSQWQCRFKLPNGQWHSMSTQQADLEAAKHEAVALYERVMTKVRQELSLKSKSFKKLAMEELADLARASAEGKGKSVYRDYTFVINKYFIPFFGTYQLTQLLALLPKEFTVIVDVVCDVSEYEDDIAWLALTAQLPVPDRLPVKEVASRDPVSP